MQIQRPKNEKNRPSIQAREIDDETRRHMVAEAAYYEAMHRNFEPGHELEDWIAAEHKVDELLHHRV